jgi:hypothetical protein
MRSLIASGPPVTASTLAVPAASIVSFAFSDFSFPQLNNPPKNPPRWERLRRLDLLFERTI